MSLVNPQNSVHSESQATEVQKGKRSSLSDGLLYVDQSDSENAHRKGVKTTFFPIAGRKFSDLPFILLLLILLSPALLLRLIA